MTERLVALPPVCKRDAPCSDRIFPSHQLRQLAGDRAQFAGCRCLCRTSCRPLTSMPSEFSNAPNAPIPKRQSRNSGNRTVSAYLWQCLPVPQKRTSFGVNGMSAASHLRILPWLKQPNSPSARCLINYAAPNVPKSKITRLDEKLDALDQETQRLKAARRRLERDQRAAATKRA